MKLQTREITSISTGYQTRKAVEPESLGTHFLLQLRDFNKERTQINPDNMVRFTPSPSNRDRVLQAGDVVFLSRGQRPFGFALPELPEPTLAASYFFVLRPAASVSGRYLAWYLNQPAAQRHFAKLGTTGAHMPIITRDVIETLKVPLPDLETQQRVAELDSLAVTQARLLAELARKKRALVNAACQHAISK